MFLGPDYYELPFAQSVKEGVTHLMHTLRCLTNWMLINVPPPDGYPGHPPPSVLLPGSAVVPWNSFDFSKLRAAALKQQTDAGTIAHPEAGEPSQAWRVVSQHGKHEAGLHR
jgi:hypothetical protein